MTPNGDAPPQCVKAPTSNISLYWMNYMLFLINFWVYDMDIYIILRFTVTRLYFAGWVTILGLTCSASYFIDIDPTTHCSVSISVWCSTKSTLCLPVGETARIWVNQKVLGWGLIMVHLNITSFAWRDNKITCNVNACLNMNLQRIYIY